VLRLFPDELGVLLSPSRVLLVRTRASGWKTRTIAEQSLAVDNRAGDWTAALEALDSELGADTWRGTRTRVVVANQWVHYELLPWSVELAKDAERLAHARHLLEATYGDVAEQWAVALSEAVPGASRLVSAMPTSLIEELDRTMQRHALRLVSLQPQLVAAFNLWRRRLPSSPAWFATIDQSSLVAMHIRDGRCDRVRAVRISDNWALELARIQTMGRLAQSRPAEGPVFVDAPQRIRALATDQMASVQWLEVEPNRNSIFARLAGLREAHA